jgi:dTDP-D-glucose 4,6-dehydratase
VTGAAGFIGSHLTEALLAQGHEVVAIDSFTDHYERASKEANAAAFPVESIDLTTDPLDLTAVDGVFHLAGRGGARSFGEPFRPYLEENVLASQRVFEAAAAAGVPRATRRRSRARSERAHPTGSRRSPASSWRMPTEPNSGSTSSSSGTSPSMGPDSGPTCFWPA